MSLLRLIVMVALVWLAPLGLRAADEPAVTPPGSAAVAPEVPEVKHEGLTLYAAPLFRIGPLAVTNSMLVTWAVAFLLIIGAQLATRNIKDVPEGAQNF